MVKTLCFASSKVLLFVNFGRTAALGFHLKAGLSQIYIYVNDKEINRHYTIVIIRNGIIIYNNVMIYLSTNSLN